MKVTVTKTVDISEFPKTRGKCPFHHVGSYQCHNERGNVSHCELGYMNGYDMRDFWFWKHRFEHCHLERDYGKESEHEMP